MAHKPLLERAFELARSGRCADVGAIERALSRESYIGCRAQLSGPSLRRTLLGLCRSAGSADAAPRREGMEDRVPG